MVVFDESNSSDDIVFGRTSSEHSKMAEFRADERPKNQPSARTLGDGTALKDYK